VSAVRSRPTPPRKKGFEEKFFEAFLFWYDNLPFSKFSMFEVF
jgi:hypothetical protein